MRNREVAHEDPSVHDRILAERLAEKSLEVLVVSVGSGKILEHGKTLPLQVSAGDQRECKAA